MSAYFLDSLTTFAGPFFVLVLVFIDYVYKYTQDKFQRKIFLALVVETFIAVIFNFCYRLILIQPDRWGGLIFAVLVIYSLASSLAFYGCLVFIDYLINPSVRRSRKWLTASVLIALIQGILVLFNFKYGFYFTFNDRLQMIPEFLNPLRIGLKYLPLLLAAGIIAVSLNKFPRAHIYLAAFFSFFAGLGLLIDDLCAAANLTWPCFSAALLYCYFFIIQSDSKIDSLTGIGNRHSFNEFSDSLNRSNVQESFAIAMIDMDHLKEINDIYGHLQGDNALRDMSSIIKSCIRNSDFAARYGGDEFILAVKVEMDIETIFKRIQAAIENQNGKKTRPYQISISYGYDIFTTASGQSLKDFLSHIDELMYKNKAAKRKEHGGYEGRDPL
ncbi:MAG: GGDEF domain-containing protein [Spirochaetales bacterium]|nr:GGDEF domain-containing protein [Spirochaetales bacterium]